MLVGIGNREQKEKVMILEETVSRIKSELDRLVSYVHDISSILSNEVPKINELWKRHLSLQDRVDDLSNALLDIKDNFQKLENGVDDAENTIDHEIRTSINRLNDKLDDLGNLESDIGDLTDRLDAIEESLAQG